MVGRVCAWLVASEQHLVIKLVSESRKVFAVLFDKATKFGLRLKHRNIQIMKLCVLSQEDGALTT